MTTIDIISQSLRFDVQALSAVSQNVANASTTGFRALRALPDFGVASGIANQAVSLKAGPFIETSNPFDLALEGDGFFALGDAGGLLLTRAGNFHRGKDGVLMDAQSRTVLGQNGAIVLGAEPFQVNERGEISQNGQLIDRLLVLSPEPGAGLQPEQGGLRVQGAALETEARVRQGGVEGANVDTAHETIALIELSRHVESVQRAISIYDKAMETGINRIGEN